MTVKYEKLWQLMADNKMHKQDLAHAASLSSYTMTQLNRSQPVGLEILMRFCKIFHCGIEDLIEITEES